MVPFKDTSSSSFQCWKALKVTKVLSSPEGPYWLHVWDIHWKVSQNAGIIPTAWITNAIAVLLGSSHDSCISWMSPLHQLLRTFCPNTGRLTGPCLACSITYTLVLSVMKLYSMDSGLTIGDSRCSITHCLITLFLPQPLLPNTMHHTIPLDLWLNLFVALR